MTLGPVAPESNPPITPFYFQPSRFPITNITRAVNAVVTMSPVTVNGVTTYPNYEIGQQVKILITKYNGMPQINDQVAYVLSVPTTTSVEIDINTTSYNAFITSPTYNPNQSQIIAIGDINSGNINSSGEQSQNTNVIGSFINISNPTNIS